MAGTVSVDGVVAVGALFICLLLSCPSLADNTDLTRQRATSSNQDQLSSDPRRTALIGQNPSDNASEQTQPELAVVDENQMVESLNKPCQYKPDASPEMVLIAAGEFIQGSTKADPDAQRDEKPDHEVTINTNFAISRCEVTVAEFRRFVELSDYPTDAEKGDKGCYVYDFNKKSWGFSADKSWRNPGFKQSDVDPVVCVSWNDAKAYIDWLNAYLQLPKDTYRLPTESEWEYAARAGTQTPNYWGSASQCDYANGADKTLKETKQYPETWTYATCSDNFINTAPVGSFKPNSWGLYDMSGNAWEWVEDCYHDKYDNAPTDGNAWLDAGKGDCLRSVRGGSWVNGPVLLRSAFRSRLTADGANSVTGFRLARTL